MPTVADRPDVLVDTSVAVALVVVDHEHHKAVNAAVGGRRAGLAGHAAFETFSVLTRLPPPLRRTAPVVQRLLLANFPFACFLGFEASRALWARLSELRIAGGSVYDALVGAAAGEHGLPLLTRDSRALETYRVLGIEVEVVPVRTSRPVL
jgi:predicted nucleic acid-binding protein